jgi:threonine/homoserine/homoserine lactone efflux protein|nr:MAG: LysE family translocator [Hyphomicrobiales bacterium]
MMESYVLQIFGGALIGILVAAPIGPVNLICIQRTLSYGSLNGFFSGLGGAVGDCVFAAVSAFGLTAIARLIEGYSTPLKLVGGLILIGYGIYNFRALVTDTEEVCPIKTKEAGDSTLGAAIAGTFALTITNPATLVGFAALFAAFGSIYGEDASFGAAAAVVLGVFAGSTLWWFAITTLTGTFHRHIDAQVMRTINHISGVIIAIFGIAVLADLFFDIF